MALSISSVVYWHLITNRHCSLLSAHLTLPHCTVSWLPSIEVSRATAFIKYMWKDISFHTLRYSFCFYFHILEYIWHVLKGNFQLYSTLSVYLIILKNQHMVHVLEVECIPGLFCGYFLFALASLVSTQLTKWVKMSHSFEHLWGLRAFDKPIYFVVYLAGELYF